MEAIILYTQCLVLAEAIACIAGFATWRKWKHGYIKWLPVYLLIITALEIGYHTSITFNKRGIASLIYEIEVPVEMFFISWFFYNTLGTKNRWLVFAGVFIYTISLIIEKVALNQPGYFFRSLSYTIGNLFILIYLIVFFIALVRSEKILTFKTSAVFWIAVGMLVFYLGTFPFYGLYNELAKNIDLFIAFCWVATSFNYCMYLFFTIGFIWGKPD